MLALSRMRPWHTSTQQKLAFTVMCECSTGRLENESKLIDTAQLMRPQAGIYTHISGLANPALILLHGAAFSQSLSYTWNALILWQWHFWHQDWQLGKYINLGYIFFTWLLSDTSQQASLPFCSITMYPAIEPSDLFISDLKVFFHKCFSTLLTSIRN